MSESRHSGFYQFSFKIAGEVVRGKTRTQLAGMAVQRARRAIDRKLREHRAKGD